MTKKHPSTADMLAAMGLPPGVGAERGVSWPRPLPVLDHDHEWVDVTELEDDERVEICAAGGCTATRRVPR